MKGYIVLHGRSSCKNPSSLITVLLLGSFHLIKVVMGAIGKFIDGSVAETILAESQAFGQMWYVSSWWISLYTFFEKINALCENVERKLSNQWNRRKGSNRCKNKGAKDLQKLKRSLTLLGLEIMIYEGTAETWLGWEKLPLWWERAHD